MSSIHNSIKTDRYKIFQIVEEDLNFLARDNDSFTRFLERLSPAFTCKTLEIQDRFTAIWQTYENMDASLRQRFSEIYRRIFDDQVEKVVLYSRKGQEGQISVHKEALMSHFSYFRVMFGCGMSESNEGAVTLDLSFNALKALENYISHQKLELDSLDVVDELEEFVQLRPDDKGQEQNFLNYLLDARMDFCAKNPHLLRPRDVQLLKMHRLEFTKRFLIANNFDLKTLVDEKFWLLSLQDFAQMASDKYFHQALDIIHPVIIPMVNSTKCFHALAAVPLKYRQKIYTIDTSSVVLSYAELRTLHELFPNLEMYGNLRRAMNFAEYGEWLKSSNEPFSMDKYNTFLNSTKLPCLPTAHLVYAKAAYRSKNYLEAEFLCRRALEYAPKNAQTHFLMACLLFRKAVPEEEKGLFHLKEAIRLGSVKIDFLVGLKVCCLQKKLWNEFFQVSEQIRQLSPDYPFKADQLLSLGNIALSLNQPKKAIKYFEESLKIGLHTREEEINVLNKLGNIFLTENRIERAIPHLQRAFNLGHVAITSTLVRAYLLGGYWERAEMQLLDLLVPLSNDKNILYVYAGLVKLYRAKIQDLEAKLILSEFESSEALVERKQQLGFYLRSRDDYETKFLNQMGTTPTVDEFFPVQFLSVQRDPVLDMTEQLPDDTQKQEKEKERIPVEGVEQEMRESKAPVKWMSENSYTLTAYLLKGFSKAVKNKEFEDFDLFFKHFPPLLDFESPEVGHQFLNLIAERGAADENSYIRMMALIGRRSSLHWRSFPSKEMVRIEPMSIEKEKTEGSKSFFVPKEQLLALSYKEFKLANEVISLPLSSEGFDAYRQYLLGNELKLSIPVIYELHTYAVQIGDEHLIDLLIEKRLQMSLEELTFKDMELLSSVLPGQLEKIVRMETGLSAKECSISLSNFIKLCSKYATEQKILKAIVKHIHCLNLDSNPSELSRLDFIPRKIRKEIVRIKSISPVLPTITKEILQRGFPNATIGTIQPESALHYVELGKKTNDQALFLKALELDPKCSSGHHQLARLELDSNKAIEKYQKAIRGNPKNIEAQCELVENYLKLGMLKEAQSTFDKMNKQNGYKSSWSKLLGPLSKACYDSANWEKAISYILANPNPDNEDKKRLAFAYLRLGNTQEAIKHFQDLQYTLSGHIGMVLLAQIYLMEGKFEACVSKCKEGLETYPYDPVEFVSCLALVLLKTQKIEEAKQLMQPYEKKNEFMNFRFYFLYKGILSGAEGRKSKACKYFSKVVEMPANLNLRTYIEEMIARQPTITFYGKIMREVLTGVESLETAPKKNSTSKRKTSARKQRPAAKQTVKKRAKIEAEKKT